jgi:hypothetical protein
VGRLVSWGTGELGKMTPAEWRVGEGVAVVDVVARRLRGHPRGLLHGNGDDGEQIVGGSNAETRRRFCTKEWMYRQQVFEGSAGFVDLDFIAQSEVDCWMAIDGDRQRRCPWRQMRNPSVDGGLDWGGRLVAQ